MDLFKRVIAGSLLMPFMMTTAMPAALASGMPWMPQPGTMVMASPAYMPVMIKGLKVHPENPLLFDFILDAGKSHLKIDGPEFKVESRKLIKYFLASLTIKEDDLWVNLSPYEKDRMITEDLGKTELGRDMLAQDYILKQLTASMIYPEKELGKAFWDRVYAKAQEQFGSTDVPIDTFNKVWIVADKAKVLEHDNAAYVVGSHLKVMLESDYEAMSHQKDMAAEAKEPSPSLGGNGRGAQELAKQVIRDIVIPEIEKEVNEGRNFAPLRQMFFAMILASWYKRSLKNALLNQVYANKARTGGVQSDDPAVKEKIYEQYLQAYKQGVFNYIKEDVDAQQQPAPRRYFSGGEDFAMLENGPEVTQDLAEGGAVFSGEIAAARVRIDKETNGTELVVAGGKAPSIKDLYRSSLEAMFQEAIVRSVRAGVIHEYRWKDQAKFAGELVAGPQTFELGRTMLEDAYKQGVLLEGRLDADGGPVDQRFGVAHDVIVEMAKHPDLRQRALELVFDPRTYGMKIDATNEQGFRETREAMGSKRPSAAPEIQRQASIDPENHSVKRVLGRFFGMASNVDLPMVPPTSQFPKVRINVSIHDPVVLGKMQALVLAVLKEVGDSDMELAERLIRFRMQLEEWDRESTQGRYYDNKAHEVEDLTKHPGLLPLLAELANSSHDDDDRGNALMYVVEGYVSAGKIQEAFDLFRKVTRVSYYRFTSTIAQLAYFSKKSSAVLDHFERISPPHRLPDFQADVADELFRLGAKKEAEYLYNKLWQSVSDSGEKRLTHRNALARGARTMGVKIGKKSAGELLNDAKEKVTAALNAWNARRDSGNAGLLWAAQHAAYELTVAGRYEEAEALAQLVDRKARIEHWGGEAGSMRPEERDQMYREMAIASAERGDVARIEQSLNAMQAYKPDALLEIAKIFARKGEYQNAMMASMFGADSVDVDGGITTDKGWRGTMTTLLSFIDQGEPAFEVAKIMLEQGMDSQRVGKVLVAATRVGLGEFELEQLVQVVRGHRELVPFLQEILQNALSKNAAIIAHSQHRVILGALREFFPQEASIAQEEVNAMIEQAGLGKEKAGEQKKDGDGAMTPGGIDLNAKNMGMNVTRDGKGIAMKLDPAMIADFQRGDLTGVVPVILQIVPIQNPLPVSIQ